MSASAFIIAEREAVFLSDGVTYGLGADSEITGTTERKVWKLRESTALIWMGARTGNIDQIVQGVSGMDAQTAINRIATILKTGLSHQPAVLALLDDNNPFNIFTFECQNGFTEYYRLFYHQDKFTPCYRGKINPGSTGALVVDVDNPNFGAYIKKYDTPDKTPEDIALQAFTEMVNDYKKQNLHVGGRIFLQVINPQINEIQNF